MFFYMLFSSSSRPQMRVMATKLLFNSLFTGHRVHVLLVYENTETLYNHSCCYTVFNLAFFIGKITIA